MTEAQNPNHSSNAPSNVPTTKVPFTLVIPAYNEEKRLPASLRDIKAFFTKFNIPLEVLVIVERSTDQTLKFAQEVAAHDSRFQVIDNKVHRGKGYAVKSGMLKAHGDIVFFMDADLSTPLTEIISFLEHFASHHKTDIVIGSRAETKSLILKKQTWIRRNLGRSFNKFVQIFGVRGIEDTQCGFKAFRAEACHEIFSRQVLNGFAFDVEVLLLAQRLGYKIDVRPVRWINSPDSKVRIWIDPFKMLWDLFRIRRIVRRTVQERPLAPSALPSH